MSGVSGSTSHDLKQSHLMWRACLTIPHALAILFAIYRLYRRTKTRQLWRDDHFAALALIFECLYFPALWLGRSSRREVIVAASWISRVVCPLLIWFTRVSFALSIARAIPPQHSMWRTSICFAYLSGFIGIFVAIGIIITCGRGIGKWDQTYPYQCPLPITSAIFRVCLSILADVALVVIPFCAFWRRLKLPLVSRRLIKACFAASILTFSSCIGVAAILFGRYYRAHSDVERAETSFLASMTTHLMASTALLVSNMLVVVTSIYRLFRVEKPIAAIRNPQPPPPASTTAQTSDLESSYRNSANGTTTTTNSSLASSRISASVTGTTAESSRIELTVLFDSDFSQPASQEAADEQRGGRNLEKCSSLESR